MPEIHPIRVRCPDSYPPCYSTGRGDENGLFNQWHELELEGSARYQTQLDRILASVNHFIQPSSDVETFNTCAIPPWYQHGVDVSVSLSSKEEEAINHEALFERIRRDPGQMLYYTDGSMLDKHVGAGLVQMQDGKASLNHSHSQYLGTQMEVYDAEMWAIQKAVALSITSNSTSSTSHTQHLWIFSDNQSAVKRIAKPTPGPGFNLVISILKHARLLENRGIQLHISWVPGHSDVEGNEHADRLAKEDTTLQDDTQEAYIFLAYLGRMVKNQRFQEWQEQWKTSIVGRSYQGSPTTKFSPLAKELSRHQVATLTQLRTGHGYFNSYLQRIPSAEVASAFCTCGRKHQTPEHLLLYCPLYSKERKEMARALKPIPLTKTTVLYTLKGTKALTTFLQSTNVATRQWILRGSQENSPDEDVGNNGWRGERVGWGRLANTDENGET